MTTETHTLVCEDCEGLAYSRSQRPEECPECGGTMHVVDEATARRVLNEIKRREAAWAAKVAK